MSLLVRDAPRTAGVDIRAAAVTGWACHLPATGELPALDLARHGGDALPAERAHELLGRKGLLAKEPATRLALCAVHRALGLPSGRPAVDAVDTRTAVVACSNLGNVQTVVGMARAVRAGSAREVSPLAAPNASSNVIASSIAIWFGFGGPNLMVCSGVTAGLDAIRLGSLLLRAGRADRVIVAGAEPDDEVARALLRARHSTGVGTGSGRVRAGAAAVVLEHVGSCVPGAGDVAVSEVRATEPGGRPAIPTHAFCLGPSLAFDWVVPPLDLERITGLYGALGVVQISVAAEMAGGDPVRRPQGPIMVVCGDDTDGWRTATVTGGGG
jgi:3-oxoacyl-[acyl-carrier-protein] synthase II